MNRGIAGILGLLFAAAVGAAPANSAGSGPVWQLQSGAGTVYIAGSMHLLRAADNALPPAFDSAYRAAEALVMELDVDDLDPLAAHEYMGTHSVLPEDRMLRDVIGHAQFAKLTTEAERLGLPVLALERLEPWAVALVLMQLELVRLGLDPEAGVEQQLERRAQRDGKPITGLETLDQQLDLLDRMSYADQARFLALTIAEVDDMDTELTKLIGAWRSGDLAALEATLLEEYASFPALYRALVTDRNRRWIPQIERLLSQKDDTLLVVGALHLVGEDGLLALLRKRGYTVTPTVSPSAH